VTRKAAELNRIVHFLFTFQKFGGTTLSSKIWVSFGDLRKPKISFDSKNSLYWKARLKKEWFNRFGEN